MSDQRGLWRARWAAVGAAVAVTVCGGGMLVVNAVSSPGASSFVPIAPCRLVDTRTASTVGSRSTPVGEREVVALAVAGTNGGCDIPAAATGVSANVTVVDGSAASFLTIWPSDAMQPTTSTNNWIAGQGPTPTKVDVKLSGAGTISVYNDVGTVNLIVDVVGYYEQAEDPSPDGGVEFAQGQDATLATGDLPIAITSIVVTAPVAGFVVVTASANLLIPSGNGVNCGISTSVDIGNTGVQYIGGDVITEFTQSRGFEVPVGDTTFFQVCQQGGGPGSTTVQNNFLTAVYSPNRV